MNTKYLMAGSIIVFALLSARRSDAQATFSEDFTGTTTLVPLGEVASPGVYFIPSLGLGAGVPIQFRSGAGTHVGARMQLTLSFPVVSIVFPVDVFPGDAGNTWQVGLFGQASS